MADDVFHLRGNFVVIFYFFFLISFMNFKQIETTTEDDERARYTDDLISPSVLVVMLVRNKEHSLPWFLGGIERLRYPKQRMSLWVRTDHNVDQSADMLKKWIHKVEKLYHAVDFKDVQEPIEYKGQKSVGHWTNERYSHIIALRQEALDEARRIWADYIFFIDADNVIYNRNTLLRLIKEEKVVVAPILNCTNAPYYSNFWGGMDSKGYYKRTTEYMDIVERTKLGTFRVPMVHSTFLIDLNHKMSLRLSFTPPPNYKGPFDDLVIWAHSALYADVPLYILNSDYFGFITSPSTHESNIHVEREWFLFLRLEAAVELETDDLPVSQFIKPEKKEKTKMGFDKIYVINLRRRVERRKRMEKALDAIGLDVDFVDAVDGRSLNESYLENLGVKMMPDYIDRFHKRPLTMGEIGCFLSHYKLWQEAVENGDEIILVLEDDVRFEPFFRYSLDLVLREAHEALPEWDLLYLGRKILFSSSEPHVAGAKLLVYPYYTYWTIGYILRLSGAKKLLDQKPLEKMVPVDEYLPIMFDHHPLGSWKSYFSPRNLVAISAEPRLVHPTHYTGMTNYVTDTEDTEVYTKYASQKPLEQIYENIARGEEEYLAMLQAKSGQETCSTERCTDGSEMESENGDV